MTNADLTCQIETGSCSGGYADLLYLKNDTNGHDNAHAELPSAASYNEILCCTSSNQEVGNSCGTTFLNLSATTDAHVQAPNGTTAVYSEPACISGSSTLMCNLSITGCSALETCLVSVASDGADNTTNAHVSSCNVYDTEVCCTMNSPPGEVTDDFYLEPFHGNATLFNRTPTFGWLNTTDPDGNAITYTIQVKKCGTADPSSCDPDAVDYSSFNPVGEFQVTSIAEGTNITEQIASVELTEDWNYTWRVRAYDGIDYGNWSENWTFFIPSTVMITVLDNEMAFGDMAVGATNHTQDNSPYPFRVRNDGNILTDINVTVELDQDWLWDRYTTPSSYFQYAIDNATSYSTYSDENSSFNWTTSATVPGWFNLPLTNNSANIRQLNFSDSTDEVEIDINITVPSDEPAGDKGSALRITGWAAL